MNDWTNHIEEYSKFVQTDLAENKYKFLEKCRTVDSRLVKHAERHFFGTGALEIFTIANGQADDPQAKPIHIGCWMMDQESVIELIEEMAEFSEISHLDADEKISKYIKPHIHNNAWFPFAVDGFGETLCVDFQPAKNGTIGQIIKVWHDCSTKELIAENFSEFLVAANNSSNK